MTTPATGCEAAAPRPAILPGGWPAHVGPFALLGAAGLYLRDHRAILPARILVHRGLNGHPDRWIPHGVAGVYGPLLLAALVVAALVLASALAQRSLRAIPAGDDLGSIERRYRR